MQVMKIYANDVTPFKQENYKHKTGKTEKPFLLPVLNTPQY